MDEWNAEKLLRRLESRERVVFEIDSASATFALGKCLGEAARAGQIYAMTGDLGAGKTMFAQGFAAGLGIAEPVNSPTFTILQVYEGGRLPLYHFDAYRLADAAQMEEIGGEEYLYGEGVSLIEWAELIKDILPETYYRIIIEKDLEKDFEYRRITVQKMG